MKLLANATQLSHIPLNIILFPGDLARILEINLLVDPVSCLSLSSGMSPSPRSSQHLLQTDLRPKPFLLPPLPPLLLISAGTEVSSLVLQKSPLHIQRKGAVKTAGQPTSVPGKVLSKGSCCLENKPSDSFLGSRGLLSDLPLSPLPAFLLTYPPATLASSLLLKQPEAHTAPGPLHWLFPLPGTLLPGFHRAPSRNSFGCPPGKPFLTAPHFLLSTVGSFYLVYEGRDFCLLCSLCAPVPSQCLADGKCSTHIG
ncbi:uncharacterized protein LOC103887956 isoform X2 [Papio anubis]|uniref:uncharacterized protein LOC103887956 isoform X2 n=1 Tax=Papio anubis TaxID=9555 RepID=UPI00083EF068|nr:uncharacterized protein LOC103887956 isoform X2 [Papio anubis]XP_031512710.1 uncharacterized protein LOC103887956 isoform X2 [Papio anubis]XP_031512711.1 uncharacterized protein LOC103887956 isoform X2 [Papio anubis]